MTIASQVRSGRQDNIIIISGIPIYCMANVVYQYENDNHLQYGDIT